MEYSDITDFVIKTTLAGLVPIVAGLIVLVLKRLAKRIGLDLDAKQEAALEHAVRQAILRVEELAAQQFRKRTEGGGPLSVLEAGGAKPWPSGREKLHAVIADVKEANPQLQIAEIERVVHAQLPQLGVGALAAVQQQAAAVSATS